MYQLLCSNAAEPPRVPTNLPVRVRFSDVPDSPSLESMVIEVKGGKHVNITAIRALRGVLEAGNAKMAGLIMLEPLGPRKRKNFEAEMA